MTIAAESFSDARRLDTSVLLGERVVSKAAGWGSNPHARAACRRGSTEKGVRLAVFFLLGEACWCESSRQP